MTAAFHPEAGLKYLAAANYYELRKPDLGNLHGRNRIRHFPDPRSSIALAGLTGDARRCLTRKFPYGVIYTQEDNDSILILAIMHCSREPGYWKSRLKS
jgi:hypothetical protein